MFYLSLLDNPEFSSDLEQADKRIVSLYVLGSSTKEIAQELNLTEGRVKHRSLRALRLLRDFSKEISDVADQIEAGVAKAPKSRRFLKVAKKGK